MSTIRRVEIAVVLVIFCAFLAIWLSSRGQKDYDMDFWYYSNGHGVWQGANYGPPTGTSPGALGQGHDLALIFSWVLINGGNFMLPLFFIVFFCFACWFMLKPIVRFPEAIFVTIPFSLILLIMSNVYFLFAQLFAMSFFFIAIGFYLRGRKIPTMLCLILMATSHFWSGFFYLGCFGIYLLIRDRKFILYLLPPLATLTVLALPMPWNPFEFLKSSTSIGSNVSYIWNVQLIENYILIPPMIYGAWRLRKQRIGLLFFITIAIPLIVVTCIWSSVWSWRMITLIPINVLEAIGVSGLLEYIAKRGGV
jgi:hypothetical protein